ncbi:MAG: hypothetical protein K0B16_18015 [Burkholderiaceae bacterium]|nr:hypothetical protein [Burkholderiaceae bacterium]
MSEEFTPPSETEQAAILSESAPGTVQSWRDEHTPERRVYPTLAEFGTVVPDNMFDGADLPTEKRQAAVKELRGMLADTGLSPVEAGHLLSRSAIVREGGKTDDQQRREARAVLAKVFNDPDAALADARKLIARDPRFAKFIARRGLGNDAEAILTIARAARSQRAAGKLK